jgi:two-component system, NarL family, invasion response regulator UvrY
MTTTPTARQAAASTFARGGRRGERGRRQLVEGGDQPVTVLVVDDNDAFRRGMVRAVERHAGLELVGEADSGAAALHAIERMRPDVVLLDLDMPGLDGLAVLERLADADVRPHVLLVSASLDDEVERAASAAGAAACIGKHTAGTDICAQALLLARQ